MNKIGFYGLGIFFYVMMLFVFMGPLSYMHNNIYSKGFNEGVRITREEAIEKQLGYGI